MQRTAPSFSDLKERQLLFVLARQLAEAQFRQADQTRTQQLWQEAAALDLDPDRLIHVLYGVADHSDLQEMEQVDRCYQPMGRPHQQHWWTPALGRFTRRGGGAWHRSAPRAGSPACP